MTEIWATQCLRAAVGSARANQDQVIRIVLSVNLPRVIGLCALSLYCGGARREVFGSDLLSVSQGSNCCHQSMLDITVKHGPQEVPLLGLDPASTVRRPAGARVRRRTRPVARCTAWHAAGDSPRGAAPLPPPNRRLPH